MSNTSHRAEGVFSKTLVGLWWAYLSVTVRMILSFLFLAILARLLSPVDFGLFGMVLIFAGLAEMIGKLAVGPAVVQRLELTDRHTETGLTLVMAIGVILAVVLWLLAPQIGWVLDEPKVPRLLRTLSVVLIINSVGVIPEHLLRRDLRFKNLAAADFLSELVGYGLTTLFLATYGFGVWALVWGTIMRRLVHVAAVFVGKPLPLRFRLRIHEAKELLQYGSALTLVGFFNFIGQRAGYFVVGRWLGATSLGFYTQAHRLTSVPFEAFSLTLLNVLFPAMSARQKKVDRLQTVYLSGMEMMSLSVVPASVAVCVSAQDIVVVVLGRQWVAIAPILQVLAVALPFRMCGALNVPVIRALGGVYPEAWRQAMWALLVVCGCYLGSRWGLAGVAVSAVVAWAVIQVLMTHLALSLLKLGWPCLLKCFKPALWVTAWAGTATWAVSAQTRAISLSPFLSLSTEFTVWLASFLVCMYFAPPFARLNSSAWIMSHLNFDGLGSSGSCLRNGLAKLLRVAHQH